MTNKEQDTYSNATSNLIKKFVDSNQRKRINLLTQIEAEVENIFNLGPSLFDIFDNDGDDWAAGWILQVLKKFNPELVIFDTGVDIHKNDKLGNLQITTEGLLKRDHKVLEFFKNNNYKKFGSNAIKFSENFTWKKIIRQYLDLI